MKRFEEKNVLITGAASGIGRATAIRIASEGANIAITDINNESLSNLAKEIEDLYKRKVYFKACDVSKHDETETAINSLVENLGGLNALSHNAGIMKLFHTHKMSPEEWKNIIDVNLTGTFNVNKASIVHLVKNPESYLVNTASSAVKVPHPWLAAYSASKGGIVSFTRSIALEYNLQGLRANCILPGGVSTPLAKSFGSLIPKDVDFRLLKGLQPISGEELADPSEIAGIIAFLASSDAKNITATELLADKGNF